MRRAGIVLTLVVFLLGVFSGCKKDDNTVKGVVSYKEALTNEVKPASNADVYLMVSDNEYIMKTQADANGNYEFYPVPDGQYWVEADYEGLLFTYSGKSEVFEVKGSDEVNMDLTLTLSENAIKGTVYIEYSDGNIYVVSDLPVYLYNAGADDPIDSTITDNNGQFIFKGLNNGSYDIDAIFIDDNGDVYYDCACDISVSNGTVVVKDLTLTLQQKKDFKRRRK